MVTNQTPGQMQLIPFYGNQEADVDRFGEPSLRLWTFHETVKATGQAGDTANGCHVQIKTEAPGKDEYLRRC